MNIAICEIKLGRYDDAEKHINKGLKYAPGFSYLLNSKIDILQHENKFDEAEKLAKELIERDKYDYSAYWQLAEIYRYKKDTQKAEDYYQESKNNAQEYYDRFCENYYDINDYDGNCGNRYEFLKDFEKSKNMSLNF